MSEQPIEEDVAVLIPLEATSPLWLSIVLAVIALVGAASSIVVGRGAQETARLQRVSSEQEADKNRTHASNQAVLNRQATLDAERVARLAVQRQAAFTQATEDLFAFSKLCHQVIEDPERKSSTGSEVKRLDGQIATDLARLRLLGSSDVANHFAAAVAGYMRSVKTSGTESDAETKTANDRRQRFILAAQRDLGVESSQPDPHAVGTTGA